MVEEYLNAGCFCLLFCMSVKMLLVGWWKLFFEELKPIQSVTSFSFPQSEGIKLICIKEEQWYCFANESPTSRLASSSCLRSCCVSVLGCLWGIAYGLCMRTLGFRDICVWWNCLGFRDICVWWVLVSLGFFSLHSKKNRRLGSVKSFYTRAPKQLMFELPQAGNIGCYFQEVSVCQ